MAKIGHPRTKPVPPTYMGGSTYLDDDGYVLEHQPSHPRARPRDGVVAQHRLVVENELLCRRLTADEVVHHIDGVKDNNDPSNLLVLSNKEHTLLHARLRGGIHAVTEEQLRKAIGQMPVRKVCAQFGITSNSIRKKYPHLMPPFEPPSADAVRAAVQKHKMQKDVAAELGVSIGCLKKYHAALLPKRRVLSETEVKQALRGRTTQEAADYLGVCHQTIRNKFPHLLTKRVSPHSSDDPETVALVLRCAVDPSMCYRRLLADHQISWGLARQICAEHRIRWIPKPKSGRKASPAQ